MTDAALEEPSTEQNRAFPMERTCPFHPPEAYAEIRRGDAPVRVAMPGGGAAWLLTAHEDVRTVLSHPGVSSDRFRPGFPRFVDLPPEEERAFEPSLIGLDPPEHSVLRRTVIGEFTVKRTRALRPRIQEIVDEHVDAMLAAPRRPVDLVAALSLPVPSMVICELLGVPYADHDFFQERTRRFISRESSREEARTAIGELSDYFTDLVAAKESDPGEDLIGRLIATGREAGTYDAGELVALARLLLIAGHETTANMISLGTVALLENPDQLAALRGDPDGLMPGAVEELLRFFAIADTVTARAAVTDIEVGGVTIRAGEGIVASGLAADHDPAAFAEPERIDVTRDARRHVAFGYGVHQCLGQNLARAELEIVYRTLFERIPGPRLAVPAAELPYKRESFVYGIHEVPVTC